VPRKADPPSPFVAAQRERLRATVSLGPCLDLACGRGRHAVFAASAGLRVVALDRDASLLRKLASQATAEQLAIHALRADAESPLGLPFPPARFGAVLVTRFLFRPLAPAIAALLAPGGLLVYETFTERQRELGYGPGKQAFLLESGELPRLFSELEVVESVEGLVGTGTSAAWLAGLVARKAARA
jgi:SAM-dependent methyltransferase